MKKNIILAIILLVVSHFAVAMNDQTKFFLKFGDERVQITRAGLEQSKTLKKIVEKHDEQFSATSFDATRNEFVIDLEILFHEIDSLRDVTFAHVKVFVELSDKDDDCLLYTSPSPRDRS